MNALNMVVKRAIHKDIVIFVLGTHKSHHKLFDCAFNLIIKMTRMEILLFAVWRVLSLFLH